MAEKLPPVVVHLMADIKHLRTGLGEAKAEMAKFEGGVKGHLAGAAHIGKLAFLGLGTAALGFGVASVHAAMNFQEAMTQLVTGAGESEKNIRMVGEGIKHMAGQVGLMPMELAKGMYMIESAGYHGAQGLTVLKSAAEGARVGGANMETVANALTTAMKDYNVPTAQAGDITSKLVATVASGKTHMEDLAASLSHVLPFASALKIPLNDALGAMATMTGNGIDAATSATYLKFTMMALANETPKGSKALDSVGLSAKQVATDLSKKGLQGTLAEITDAIGRKFPVGSAEYVAALAKIVGGTRGMGAALNLTGQNMKTYIANVKSVGDAHTEAGGHVSGFALTQKDLKTQIENLKASFGALEITVGEKLIPIIESAAHWFMEHKTAAEVLAGVIGGVLVAAMAVWIGELTVATAKAVWSFAAMTVKATVWAATQAASLAESAVLWSMYAAESIAAFASMAVAGMAWAASMVAAGAMALLPFLPIIAAVAAVGAAAYLLYDNWDKVWTFIKDITHTAFEWIKDHMALIVGAIFLIYPPLALLIAAVKLVWTHWHTIWEAIKTVTTAVVKVLHTIFDALVKTGLTVIRTELHAMAVVWDAVFGVVKAVVSTAWQFIHPIFDAVRKAGIWVLKTEIQGFKNIWDRVWGGIVNTVHAVWSVLKPIFDTIKAAIGDIVGGIGKVADVAGTIGHGIGSATSGIGHLLGFDTGGVVPGPVGSPMLAVVHGGEEVWSMDHQRRGVGPRGASSGGGSSTTVSVTHAPVINVSGTTSEEILRKVRLEIDRSNAELVRMLKAA